MARFPGQVLKAIARFEGSTLKATSEKSARDKENLDGHGKLKITESPSQVSKCHVFSFLSRLVLIQISVTESLAKNHRKRSAAGYQWKLRRKVYHVL